MDIRLLGGIVEYQGSGGPAKIPGTSARAILTMLALRPGALLLRDEIIEGLWGRRFPHDPTAAIQVTVSRLRSALGADRHRLKTVPLGYLLDVTNDQVDVSRAEEALRAGRRLLHDGEIARAEVLLSEGLGEWHHEAPLVEFADLPFGPGASSRLFALRCDLVEACNETALLLSRPEDIPARTEAMIRLDPWRESLVAQLMRAFHETGRTPDALGAYASFAATLKADLNVEPSANLQDLHRQIAARDLAMQPSSVMDLRDEALPVWFEAALEELDRAEEDPLLQGRLQLALAQAEQQAGLPRWEQTLRRATQTARGAGDTNLVARCLLAGAPGWSASAGTADKARLTEIAAVLESNDLTLDLRARLLAAYANEQTFVSDLRERIALSDSAVGVARQSGNPATLLAVLNQRFNAIWAPETHNIRLRDTAQACDLAEQLGHGAARAVAEGFAMAAAAEAADIDSVDEHLNNFVSLAKHLRLPIFEWGAAVHLGWRATLADQFEAAEELAEQAWHIGHSAARPEADIVHASQIAAVRWHQGRLGEHLPTIEPLVSYLPAFQALCSSGHLQAGNQTAARRLLNDAWESGAIHSLRHDQLYISALVLWADVAVTTQQTEAAEGLYTMMMPFESRVAFTGASYYGPVAQHLAQLADILDRPAAARTHHDRWAQIAEQLRRPSLSAN